MSENNSIKYILSWMRNVEELVIPEGEGCLILEAFSDGNYCIIFELWGAYVATYYKDSSGFMSDGFEISEYDLESQPVILDLIDKINFQAEELIRCNPQL
jgi:hypothetical protein